jgi:hypothetical protein
MNKIVYILTICISIVILALAFFLPFETDSYKTEQVASTVAITLPPVFEVTHIKTPTPVKAIYMSGWVAGNSKLRNKLVDLIDKTEINAVVIDIKDYTGKISFEVDSPKLKAFGSTEKRIPDIKEFIGRLHEKGIYVIGRISSFQDSYLVKTHPELAVKDKAGNIWRDRKGIAWLDVGAKPAWEYLALIGQEAYDFGFDELNFDYIRYPSDGNMENISFPFSNGKSKPAALKEFYAFVDKTFRPKGIPISADLFGMTTSNNDDLGIGQILGDALIHFDFVAPMVYPSHYPKTFLGYSNPASKPYEIIKYAMDSAVVKANLASTSPNKLRPWLQDFSLGGVEYSPEMVRAQIQATYDTGLDSWMLWNASNVYTASALKPETETVDKAVSSLEKKEVIKKVD